MPKPYALLPDGFGASIRSKIKLLYLGLFAFNAAAWAMAFLQFRGYPLLIGTSFLAYSFGLRHAVDADHIAAIDNVTRKLGAEGRRPLCVGLLFSLGHSTIVVLASAFIAVTATTLDQRYSNLKEIGAVVGTLISTLFLIAIACVNLRVLCSAITALKRVHTGVSHTDEHLEQLFVSRGLFARLCRPLFRLINKSWHMYFLGFLFGLGFDTATEVGILGISATGSSRGLPVWSILIFPLLFTAGMALVDTSDSILMQGAYGWAQIDPVRKLSYNIIITGFSVGVAVVVGAIEAFGLITRYLDLHGRFWDAISSLNDHSEAIGYAVVGVFAATWAGWAAFARWKQAGVRNNTGSVA
jgi:high-affinity nickel-transport protein